MSPSSTGMNQPSQKLTIKPTVKPTAKPTTKPTTKPTMKPTEQAMIPPTKSPMNSPSNQSNWNQLGNSIVGTISEYFGYSTSLSADGTIIAVGATGRSDSVPGLVRVYRLDEQNWNQLGANIDGETAGDKSGSSISLSADGYTIAIGAIVMMEMVNPLVMYVFTNAMEQNGISLAMILMVKACMINLETPYLSQMMELSWH